MPELPSRLDYYDIGRRYILSRARRIDPTQVDVEGSDINLFVGSTSFAAHAVSRQLATRLGALLLDGCETDDDLDRFAFDRYQENVLRKGAAAAVGEVVFTRPTSAAGAGSIPTGTKLATLTGIEYVMTSPAIFGALALEARADVRALLAGKETQVGRNTIRRFAGPPPSFDPTIQVNNPEPTAGGEPAETFDVFRERIRAFWDAARRGTLSAIAFGALRVPGVESARAEDVLDANLTPARAVRLFIADSSGVSNKQLVAKVETELLEYRCGGIFVIIESSAPLLVSVQLKLTFAAGIDTVALRSRVLAAIVTFINSLGVNAPLLLSDLYAVLARFRQDGLIVDQSTITVPAGDVIPPAGFTLRVNPFDVVAI